MEGLLKPLGEIEEFNGALSSLNKDISPIMVTGIFESQKAHVASGITKQLDKPSIFVAPNEIYAKKIYNDLKFFLNDRVVFYPSKDIMLYNVEAEGMPLTSSRLSVIQKMISSNNYVVVVSIDALQNKMPPLEAYKESIKVIKIGERYSIEELSKYFVSNGYTRNDLVEGKGQFSIRGSIVDFYQLNDESPYRIDFFGDEVDSIKIFEIESQISISNQKEVSIFPARELIFDNERAQYAIDRIKKDLEHLKENIKIEHKEYVLKLEKKLLSDIDKISNGIHFAGIEKYVTYFYDNAASLIEFMPQSSIVYIDEYSKIEQAGISYYDHFSNTIKDFIERGNVLPKCSNIVLQFNNVIKLISEKRRIIHLDTFQHNISDIRPIKHFNIDSKPIASFNGKVELMIEDIKKWKAKNYKIAILAGSTAKAKKMLEVLNENNIFSRISEDLNDSPNSGEVIIINGSLDKGFEYPLINFVLISDRELLGEDRKRRKKKKILGQKIKAFSELSPGDYVVHQIQGIGQYVGIEKLKVEGIIKDYFKIKYLQGDLFVPVNQLDLIQKYIGSEGKIPKVNRLGGVDWNKTKSKVKESVQELAKGLIRLYAEREILKGFEFSKDTIWQKQFEETFLYQETDDQLQCIEEVKLDMEKPRPMDRLLCGDVGYGKTEVAIRAAFKAVMDGKQVAYLVPTTILAQQHFNNFVQRMKDFPVTVEMLSRFRSPKEQKEIVKGIKEGQIDIIIGTHRIIQKDMIFKDLGLIIIDEEQRFGVTHKEKLKELKKNVDVLTLTATPIPRTLHMSLLGVRDMSVIEEPPEERHPVQTYVLEHENDFIRDAILREVSRGGQVFYLYNRVASIHTAMSKIQNLVPEAKVAFAHGQMSENELEDIIVDFLDGQFDVLVCTTIIETGLDMQNVNTIIIEDADKMGLAQLYQLRGRVGRSNRQAYAYLTFRKDKVLSEDAEKRLKAIKEFTEFGSGFKIAMRDLQIRGAGNLLGPEQHGQMNSVGYDMYCKILEDTIKELKGEKVKEVIETSIDINISAYIDDTYINNSVQKISMYKKIAAVENFDDTIEIKEELIDRYGDIPKETDCLIEIAYIKTLCKDLNIASVTQKHNNIIFEFNKISDLDIASIGKISEIYKRRILFTASNTPYITFKIDGMPNDKLLENIKILLQNLKKPQ